MQSLGSSGGDIINQLSQYSTVTSPVVALSSSVSENDVCRDRPCSNNASCVQSGVTFTCVCEPGYTGVLCETGEHSPGEKVGISSWEEMFFFFFFPAFCVKPSRLADDCERRLSQSMWESGSKLSLRLIWFANNFSSLRVTHRSSEPRWESSLDSGGFSTKTLAELSSLLIDLQWNLNPVQN